MIERWAKPVIPLGHEDSGRRVKVGSFEYCRTTYVLEPGDVERVRLGYVCINCLEPHPVPYPLGCAVCGFPMRLVQPDAFEKLYEGEELAGPRTTLEEEWEMAGEAVKRGRWHKRAGAWIRGD